jgi:hypothetical protein
MESEKEEFSVWHPVSKLMSPLEFLIFGINMIFLLDYWCEQDQVTRTAMLIQTAETYYAVDIMTNLQQIVLLLFMMKLSLTASRRIKFEIQDPEVAEVSTSDKIASDS